MRFLIDVNLSPDCTALFSRHGLEAVHWFTVGDPRADDQAIMSWARTHGYIIFTHDLDFGAMLALTQTSGPSVIQVRTYDVSPDHLEPLIIPVIRKYQAELDAGALIVVEEARSRVRILPLAI
jgi:predicted nuclease of predicted toxin-antitoxin system